MPGLMSQLALTLRRWRGRMGISAPRVAVRTHVPWHWRAISVVVLAGISLALAGWIYDAGRRFAGFHHQASDQELTALRTRVQNLTDELEDARKIANSSDSRLKIESTAQDRLAAQVRSLEDENNRLKSDLAMFENLIAGQDGPATVEISRMSVVKDGGDGQYRYSLLVAQKGSGRDREFKGRLQLTVTVQNAGGADMIELPAPQDGNATRYSVVFRYFGRVDGTFSVPGGRTVKRVEARLLEGATVKANRAVEL